MAKKKATKKKAAPKKAAKSDCLFCRIISGEIPSAKFYEDKDTFVFLDIAPASPKGGHTLVIPKKHYEFISDVPDKELAALSKTVKMVSKALMKYGQGMNIIQNNGKVAGQYVHHVHFHLIPRFAGDGVSVGKWSAFQYPKGEIEKVAAKLKKLL